MYGVELTRLISQIDRKTVSNPTLSLPSYRSNHRPYLFCFLCNRAFLLYLPRLRSLEIIYRDEHLIAINKPHGLLVHRSTVAADAMVFAIQMLRNQIGRHVYPVHRLDRKTSGVLLFALNNEMNAAMQRMFASGKISKTYLAIVRGYTDDTGTIDYPLKSEKSTFQDAITHYRTLRHAEIDFPSHTHATSRYSLVEVKPANGRMHQIRRHLAHIRHPIIGDRPHGCNKQNRFFKHTFQMDTMLLHASRIEFAHPILEKHIGIGAEAHDEFKRMLKMIFNIQPNPKINRERQTQII